MWTNLIKTNKAIFAETVTSLQNNREKNTRGGGTNNRPIALDRIKPTT